MATATKSSARQPAARRVQQAELELEVLPPTSVQNSSLSDHSSAGVGGLQTTRMSKPSRIAFAMLGVKFWEGEKKWSWETWD